MLSVYTNYSSPYRMTGLFSGFDTDALVKSMAKAEQARIDKTYVSKTKAEWKKNKYDEIHTKVQSFQNKFLSSLSSDNVWTKNLYTVDMTSKENVDQIVNKVKGFINEYNTLVSDLNGLIHEKKNYKYDVLTQSQREEMDKEDIAEYDAASKQGILRNDSGITSLLSSMRSALYAKVGDTGLSASDIGLGTGTWNKYGEITFNETKFREALQNNAEGVAKVMAGVSDVDGGDGLATKLASTFTNYRLSVSNTSKKLDNEINQYTEKIESQLDKLYEKQEKYYQQFAQLEKLMANYQSQTNYFSSFFN